MSVGLRRVGLCAGLVLLAGYVVPLLVSAPPAVLVDRVPAGASLLERLYPGVPGAWILARLACLTLGALLLAALWRGAPDVSLGPGRGEAAPARGRLAWLALALAALHAGVAPLAARLPGMAQMAYVLLLALPPFLLFLAGRAHARPGSGPDPARRRGLLAAAAVVVAWALVRVPLAWGSPRIAEPVDMWPAFEWLLDAVAHDRNVLVASGQAGIGNAYMIFQGYPLLGGLGPDPTLGWIQGINLAWVAASAGALALLAASLLPPVAVPVVTAGYLFAPIVLLMTFCPSPYGIYFCISIGLFLLLLSFARSRAPWALAGLGALAGFSTTTAYVVPITAACGLVTLWLLWRRRPHPGWLPLLTGILLFVAAALPALPDLQTVAEMRARYATLNGEWNVLERVVQGQRSFVLEPMVWNAWKTGRTGPLEIALGALLSPFVSARAGIRMWGDAIFEPLSAALFALGVLLCARHVRRRPGAAVLLVGALVTLLPAALASAYDRASLTRNIAAPAAVALLSGVGFCALLGLVRSAFGGTQARARASGARGLVAALLASAAIGASGSWLFDTVTPRSIGSSWLTLAVEALGEPPAPGAVLLQYGPKPIPWMFVDLIAAALPQRRVPTFVYEDSYSLDELSRRFAETRILVWSPALESDHGVARAVCRHWPQARLLTLRDRSGLAAAYAAWRHGADAAPALPPERVASASCEEGLPPIQPGPGAGRSTTMRPWSGLASVW